MRRKTPQDRTATALVRIREIHALVAAMTYVCSGSLVRRMKVCGRQTCPCCKDPAARHGPYFEWGRMQEGRLVHTMLPPAQARLMSRAIANYRVIRRLLHRWERHSVQGIEAEVEATVERATT